MIIINKHNKSLFWSNEFGWIENKKQATKFNKQEMNKINLPIDGEWR
jgi:hypothetical protein